MSRTVIVDTNVAVVANRDAPQASPQCVLACVRRLQKIMSDEERLAIDNQWLIISEYRANLRSSGQPGVGGAFLKWVLTNRENRSRCDIVAITRKDGDKTSFHEFPSDPALQGFDLSDRKFVAVALAHPQHPPILQAVDSKWCIFRDSLDSHGVTIDFLCTDDIRRLSGGIQ